MRELDFLLAGVGGQGTILAGDILAEVGLEAGYDVKKSEVHGMSQRGGGVESHVRWGREVQSPLVEKGTADYLLGFEMLEGARWAGFLSPGGEAIVNRYRIAPPTVSAGKEVYPPEEVLDAILRAHAPRVRWVDATDVARRLGHPALAGVVLLGVLSTRLDVGVETWLGVVRRLVPARFVDLNRQAFEAGREVGAADSSERR